MHRSLTLAPLAVSFLVLAAGCASSNDVSGDRADQGAEAVSENGNDKTAFDFFLAKGLSPVQAAGIVGNLDQESSMDPTVYQYGGGPGRGIAQWSAGGRWDSSPNANVLWYAGQMGESAWSLNLQLEFIWWELTNEGYGYAQLTGATTVEDAVAAFQDRYEICGQCDSSNRIAHAYAALQQFGADMGGSPPPPANDCGVHDDGKLYCGDTAGAALYADHTLGSAVVNHLQTSYSWFTCWGTGDLHAGGNTTWYYTLGDDNGNWGWVPAVDLNTASDFDANPSAHGLAECAGQSPPPPPQDDPNCDVHTDGKLYCGNSADAAMYAADNYWSGVVNTLRSTNSWFTCWGTGEQHAGGNTTWYYTLGDDNGNWGWVPAVDLDTTSDFDADPSAHGLARCN